MITLFYLELEPGSAMRLRLPDDYPTALLGAEGFLKSGGVVPELLAQPVKPC